MRISVITVVRNAADSIADTIESVLSQQATELEYIVVDGASTDGTLAIVRRYGDRIAHVVSEPDGGLYDAMNKGIRLATGDVIGIMNSGDRYLPGALRALEAAQDAAGAILFGGVVRHFPDTGKTLTIPADASAMPRRMGFCHQSAFVPRSVHARIGAYDTQYQLAADYEFFLRARAAGVPFVGLGLPVAWSCAGGTSDRRVFRLLREYRDVRRRSGVGFDPGGALELALYGTRVIARRAADRLLGAERVAGMIRRAAR